MDEMESLLVECLGIPLQDDISRNQDHLDVGEKRQHDSKYGEENPIIASVAKPFPLKPHLQSLSWLARARDVLKRNAWPRAAQIALVPSMMASNPFVNGRTLLLLVVPGEEPRKGSRFSRAQPMIAVSKIGRQSTKRRQHSN